MSMDIQAKIDSFCVQGPDCAPDRMRRGLAESGKAHVNGVSMKMSKLLFLVLVDYIYKQTASKCQDYPEGSVCLKCS